MALDEELLNRPDEETEDYSAGYGEERDADEADEPVSGDEAEEALAEPAEATDPGSADAAAALRAEKMAGKNGGDLETTGNLRTDKKKAKQKQGAKDKAKNKVKQAALSPIKKSLAKLLQSAWKELIPSWGATLLWIDAHVFFGYVFGKDVFCDLGEEWLVDAPPLHVGVNEDSVKIPSEKAGKMAGLIETMGCGCLNCGCFLLVLSVLAIIAMIVGVVTNPLEAIKALLGALWGAIKSI